MGKSKRRNTEVAMFTGIHYTVGNIKNGLRILTQIAEDLLDSRLYVIKATMCWRGRKIRGGNAGKKKKRKGKSLPLMSTLNCFFSHALSPNSTPGWVF